jgi:hypothetical protein
VHRTLHCAMSGALAAARSKFIFLCAVRWFTGQLLCAVRCAPDRHCRLSGAPYSVFRKPFPCPSPRPGSISSLATASLGLWRHPLRSGDPSLTGGDLSGDLQCSCFPSLSGEHHLLSLSSLSVSAVSSPLHPFVPNSNFYQIL